MKPSLLKISKWLFFLLILSINLREPYIHSREILFFLFIICSFPFGNYNKLSSLFCLLVIWGISLLYNIIIPGSNAMNGPWFQGIIISAYLFLLVFCTKKYYRIIINAFMCSAIVVSSITIILWFLCNYNLTIRYLLIDYFTTLYEKTQLTFVDIGDRMILGSDFQFVWYRTCPIIIPALGYLYLKRLYGEKKKKNFFGIIFFSLALVLSGTRANILTSFLMLLFFVVFKLLKIKKRIIAVMIAVAVIICTALIANRFFNDKGSMSSFIKAKATQSYYKVYNSDIVRTFFFGWGCGSSFYHSGRNKIVDVTELSHLESVRRYGLFPFLFIMIFVWLKPLINKLKLEKGISKYFYVVVVLSYIFVACTNPYLLDSIGFCVLLFFTAFFEYDTFHRNDNIQRRLFPSKTT